jgi:hypothetical protein
VAIFNATSADIKTKSADVILKMTTILKEMRIAQLCSKSEPTFGILRNFIQTIMIKKSKNKSIFIYF